MSSCQWCFLPTTGIYESQSKALKRQYVNWIVLLWLMTTAMLASCAWRLWHSGILLSKSFIYPQTSMTEQKVSCDINRLSLIINLLCKGIMRILLLSEVYTFLPFKFSCPNNDLSNTIVYCSFIVTKNLISLTFLLPSITFLIFLWCNIILFLLLYYALISTTCFCWFFFSIPKNIKIFLVLMTKKPLFYHESSPPCLLQLLNCHQIVLQLWKCCSTLFLRKDSWISSWSCVHHLLGQGWQILQLLICEKM